MPSVLHLIAISIWNWWAISEVAIPSLHALLRLLIAKQNRSGVAKEWVYYRNPIHLLVGLQVFCEQVAAARDFAAATINASQNES
jgi:hypothetical protein